MGSLLAILIHRLQSASLCRRPTCVSTFAYASDNQPRPLSQRVRRPVRTRNCHALLSSHSHSRPDRRPQAVCRSAFQCFVVHVIPRLPFCFALAASEKKPAAPVPAVLPSAPPAPAPTEEGEQQGRPFDSNLGQDMHQRPDHDKPLSALAIHRQSCSVDRRMCACRLLQHSRAFADLNAAGETLDTCLLAHKALPDALMCPQKLPNLQKRRGGLQRQLRKLLLLAKVRQSYRHSSGGERGDVLAQSTLHREMLLRSRPALCHR